MSRDTHDRGSLSLTGRPAHLSVHSDCSSHLVPALPLFSFRAARAKARSRTPGNKTKIQTRAADHGFGEQPQPNTSLTGQAKAALPEARAAKALQVTQGQKWKKPEMNSQAPPMLNGKEESRLAKRSRNLDTHFDTSLGVCLANVAAQ